MDSPFLSMASRSLSSMSGAISGGVNCSVRSNRVLEPKGEKVKQSYQKAARYL